MRRDAKPANQELADICKALFVQGVRQSDIVKKTGVKLPTLKTWIERYGWRGVAKQAEGLTCELEVESASQRLRRKLNTELESQINVLLKDSAKVAKNVIGGRAKAVKTLTETASIIHSWNENKANTLVQVNILNQTTSAETDLSGDDNAIDV